MYRTSRAREQDPQPHPLWLFEENYLLLRRLFPDFGSGRRYVLSAGSDRHALQAVVEECGRYTTTLTLSNAFGGDARLLPPLLLTIRIYHDARLAEVTGYQACRHIPPGYAASAGQGFQRDERQQVNRLLHEVLRYCRSRGYAVDDESDRADVA